MKNLFKLLLLSIVVNLGLNSCQQDIDLPAINVNDIAGNQSFIYKGDIYESDFYVDQDSSVIFTNEIVNEVAEKLRLVPNLASFVHSNGQIEYFDNMEDFNKLITDIKREYSDNPELRGSTAPNWVTFYEDSKLHASRFTLLPRTEMKQVGVIQREIDGRMFNFSRKISSLDMGGWGTMVTIFTGQNFGGQLISWVVNRYDHPEQYAYIHYLKSYQTAPGSRVSFNDNVGSIIVDKVTNY